MSINIKWILKFSQIHGICENGCVYRLPYIKNGINYKKRKLKLFDKPERTTKGYFFIVNKKLIWKSLIQLESEKVILSKHLII